MLVIMKGPELRVRLQNARLKPIIEKTGLSYMTLSNIAHGKTPDPRVETAEKITNYFLGVEDEATATRNTTA